MTAASTRGRARRWTAWCCLALALFAVLVLVTAAGSRASTAAPIYPNALASTASSVVTIVGGQTALQSTDGDTSYAGFPAHTTLTGISVLSLTLQAEVIPAGSTVTAYGVQLVTSDSTTLPVTTQVSVGLKDGTSATATIPAGASYSNTFVTLPVPSGSSAQAIADLASGLTGTVSTIASTADDAFRATAMIVTVTYTAPSPSPSPSVSSPSPSPSPSSVSASPSASASPSVVASSSAVVSPSASVSTSPSSSPSTASTTSAAPSGSASASPSASPSSASPSPLAVSDSALDVDVRSLDSHVQEGLAFLCFCVGGVFVLAWRRPG